MSSIGATSGGGGSPDVQSVRSSAVDSDESPPPTDADPESRRSSIDCLSLAELRDHVRQLHVEQRETRRDNRRALLMLEARADAEKRLAEEERRKLDARVEEVKRLAEEEKRLAEEERKRADHERRLREQAEAALKERYYCIIA